MRTLPEFHPDPAYTLTLARHRRPIVIIGAGGIVRDAHLPAYDKANYPVFAIVDPDISRAHLLAEDFGVARVASILADLGDLPADVVFDVAVPPDHIVDVLRTLPHAAAVLIQKPLGDSKESTLRILELCEKKGLIAAVNTQLRFAPYVAAARKAIAEGEIGELYDIEIGVEVNTPWEMFPYVQQLDRLELHMHSIHYLDLIRSFVGDPASVSCATERRPGKTHANSRSAVILHYPDRSLRALVATNHDHRFGPRYEQSFIKWEGTRGAIRAQMGLLLNYPDGREDALEIFREDDATSGWQPLAFTGSWFPDAFIGSMSALQRFLEGSADTLITGVGEVQHTMAVIEAAYESAARGGVVPEYGLRNELQKTSQ